MAQPPNVSEPKQPSVGPTPGSVAPMPNPSPVTAPEVPPGYSPNAQESLGPRNMISQSGKNPSPVEPLPQPTSQGHVMSTAMPWMEMGHNPAGPAYQRPFEEF
jgi:hypothetical protein